MSAQVRELREFLERRFPDTVPVAYRAVGAMGTGIAELDRMLPGGGLPRGRLVVWAVGGGATAVLRSACGEVTRRGERAAWVDGTGVITGDGSGAGVELVKPAGVRQALECAEELLRSGGFGLVVLAATIRVGPVGGRRTGRGGEGGTAGVRLSRAAREGGGAFVWVGGESPVASLRIRSRIAASAYRWRADPFGDPTEVESVKVRVSVDGLGLGREAEFRLPVVRGDVRLSLEPDLVDRRGAGV